MLCIFMCGRIIKVTKLQKKKDADILIQMNALYYGEISILLVCSPEKESVA